MAKKISRATLIKSERAKERNLERVREMRRRKRAAVAARGKGKKYRSAHWIAKHAAENYDDNEPEYSSSKSRKKGGRGSRFPSSSSKKPMRKRRFKVNPKYLKKYADQHQGDKSKSPTSSRSEDKNGRVRDPEAYDVRDRRDRAMSRRPGRGGSKRTLRRSARGRGKVNGRRERPVRGKKRSKKNGYSNHGDDHHDGDGGNDRNGTVEAFNGYSRKRGHQTWQRAR